MLSLILHLAVTVVLPIAALVAIGWLLDRRFRVDLPTLVRLNFWVFVPALAFVKLVQAPLSTAALAQVAWFAGIQIVILAVLGALLGLLPALRSRWRLLALGSCAYNIGNYGIPLVTFAFGQRWLGVVIAILVVQNVALFTLGPLLIGGGKDWRTALRSLLGVPVVHAVGLALILRAGNWDIPAPLLGFLGPLADALVPIALLTLGVQIARTPLTGGGAATAALLGMRLVVSPVLAWVLAGLLGISGDLRTVLTISAALPMAVNVFLLCSEYRHHPEDAARGVLWTTVVATLLLPLLIALFPALASG